MGARADRRKTPVPDRIDLRAACDALPQIVWFTTGDGLHEHVNVPFVEFTGVEPPRGQRAPLLGFVHPDDREAATASHRAGVAAGVPHEETFRLRRHDGAYRWHLARSVPVRSEDGTILHWLGTATDVDDLRRADDALRASEQRCRDVTEGARFQAQLFAAVQQAIVATDPSGRVLSWNRGAETLYGWLADEAIGRDFAELVVPVSEPEAVLPEPSRQRQVAAQTSEQRVRRKDGREIWISVCSVPIRDARGVATHVVAASNDITERRQLEERFHHAQKMEAIGRLAGGIAHDFNNLLTVISASAEFLSSALPEGGDLRPDVDEIARAAQRAAGLTRQLLAFSRQQVLNRQVLDPNVTISQLETMFGRLIGEDVSLRVTLDPKTPMVFADEGQLEQAVANLVVNARDAMPHGGRLGIETRAVALSARDAHRHDVDPGPYVAIAIADNGVGMNADVRARIFEPFFTTKEAGRGTGLGLATVYGIVRQLGGFVEVESTVGSGSTFTIFIPATGETTSGRRTDETLAAEPGHEEMVLVVEDQPDVRAVVCRILSRHGYRVLEASDGVEALLHLDAAGAQLALIVSDAVMPGMSGRELLRSVRAVRPQLPYVLMSGYADVGICAECHNDERTAFVGKPIRAQHLLRTVRNLIAKRAA